MQGNRSLDPFEIIIEDIHEIILQHLSGKDILTACEVSHSWCDLISNSKLCLDKVSLVVNEKTAKLDCDVLERNYQHLIVGNEINFRKGFGAQKIEKMIELMEMFSGSLRTIEVKTLLKNEYSNMFEGTLTKLERLRIMCLNQTLLKMFSSTLPNLKALEIGSTILFHNELIGFLAQFHTLEALSIRYNIFDRMFSDDASDRFNFKLRSLTIQKTYNGRTESDENFEKFLIAQKGTLKEMHFINIAHTPTINLIFNELTVETMTVNFIDEPLQLNPKTNTNMTNLIMKNEENCVSLLKALPNLKKFHVQKITRPLIVFLASEMKFLTTVTYNEKENDFDACPMEYYRKYLMCNPNQLLNKNIQYFST